MADHRPMADTTVTSSFRIGPAAGNPAGQDPARPSGHRVRSPATPESAALQKSIARLDRLLASEDGPPPNRRPGFYLDIKV